MSAARVHGNGAADSADHTSSPPSSVPRVALCWPQEAAAALGVSPDTLERHDLAAEVRLMRLGRLRLVAIDELERLVREQSTRALEE